MTEEAILVELRALGKAMDRGFAQVHGDITDLKADVKRLNAEGLPRRVKKLEYGADALREEGLPRRTKKLEDWRDSLRSRWWALLIGVVVAVASAWLGLIFLGGN